MNLTNHKMNDIILYRKQVCHTETGADLQFIEKINEIKMQERSDKEEKTWDFQEVNGCFGEVSELWRFRC